MKKKRTAAILYLGSVLLFLKAAALDTYYVKHRPAQQVAVGLSAAR